MTPTIHYQLQLTAVQADFLSDQSYGHNRMNYFMSLVKMAALKPYPSLVVGSTDIIGIGMVERSINQLSDDWQLDYKTTKEMVKKMNDLGIITTSSTPRTSIHKLLAVAAWIVDTVVIHNPCFNRGFDRQSVHTGSFDSTAIAEEFNVAMNESITSYKSKMPKGGRGKKKSSADTKVILPTIQGLELYEQLSATAKTLTNESLSPADDEQSHPSLSAVADGSVSLPTTAVHGESEATSNHSVSSTTEGNIYTPSSSEREADCPQSSVTAAAETSEGQPHSGSTDDTTPLVVAPSTATVGQP